MRSLQALADVDHSHYVGPDQASGFLVLLIPRLAAWQRLDRVKLIPLSAGQAKIQLIEVFTIREILEASGCCVDIGVIQTLQLQCQSVLQVHQYVHYLLILSPE